MAEDVRPSLPDSLPAEVSNVIQRCWHGRPSRRPSMNEVCVEGEISVVVGRALTELACT